MTQEFHRQRFEFLFFIPLPVVIAWARDVSEGFVLASGRLVHVVLGWGPTARDETPKLIPVVAKPEAFSAIASMARCTRLCGRRSMKHRHWRQNLLWNAGRKRLWRPISQN